MTPKRPMEIMQDNMDGPRQLEIQPDAASKHLVPFWTSIPEPWLEDCSVAPITTPRPRCELYT